MVVWLIILLWVYIVGFVALLVVIFNISCLILGIIILVIVLADYIMVIGVYYLMVYYYIVGIIRV